VLVFVMGAMRLRHPIDLPTAPLLVAAGGGLLTEIISLRLLYSGQKGDLNLRGAFWHVMQTFIGSILIIITAAVIYFTGFLAIDPILGMTFGLVLLAASWGIIRSALSILMEGAPQSVDLIEVATALGELPGTRDVHHMHAWSLTSDKNVLSAHIRTDRAENAAPLLEQAHRLLRDRFGFSFSTLQVETTCLDEGHARELDISVLLDKPKSG